MHIVVDAMGGDHAPKAPVEGVLAFVRERTDVQWTLIGDETKIRSVATIPDAVHIIHTDETIHGDDEPVRAVRRKPNASLVMAAQMVRDGTADAMISAGNTGALVASGLLVVGRMEGIDRPALAPVLPTLDSQGVLLLDAGATMDATSRHLLQFAQMGHAYSHTVLGVEKPRVALLNVGSEPGKGNAIVKEAYQLMSECTAFHFVGNVEARELLYGHVDVAVCDGFVGNVVLKLIEGVGSGMFKMLKEAMTSNWISTMGALLSKKSLLPLRRKLDYAEYGGAPFLGVNGGCFKAHGSSNGRAWYMTCTQAARFVERRLLDEIRKGIGDATENSEPPLS